MHESLAELARLADTAGLQVVGETYQLLNMPSPSTYIGSGKLSEIISEVRANCAHTVIFDDELSAGQQRNLEKALGEGVRVADRTALILDIFESRAQSSEGRLQACVPPAFRALLAACYSVLCKSTIIAMRNAACVTQIVSRLVHFLHGALGAQGHLC